MVGFLFNFQNVIFIYVHVRGAFNEISMEYPSKSKHFVDCLLTIIMAGLYYQLWRSRVSAMFPLIEVLYMNLSNFIHP
jgi:hypothetical protein